MKNFSDFYRGYNIDMNLTQTAQEKVLFLLDKESEFKPYRSFFLRLEVQPGGCSGLRYNTYFDYKEKEDDHVINYDGFDLRIDKMSFPYLNGATMDFADTIDKQGFTIDNPNSVNECACGDSFH
jgi:iron-sulfur cluster assembly accessory protein